MKKLLALAFICLTLTSCNKDKDKANPNFNCLDYGAFLGRYDNNVQNFSDYNYISLELDEFTDSNISRLSRNGTKVFAYLNVGSLENYRDYYDDFVAYTFMDYEDWPDERWIDVSTTSWQNFLVNEIATDFKARGAYGVYLDNVDVYTVAKEENMNYSSFASGLKNIIKGVSNLGLKIMMNGGSEFLDDMNDQEDNIFDYIWAYHQEEVFSLIDDYENDVFTAQDKEDKEYYQEIAKIMKSKGKEVFFLEYSKDQSLIEKIINYCNSKEYHCYISSNVNLE